MAAIHIIIGEARCHEPEYLQFITTILTFILDLSNISLQIIFSYPFRTAFYGLMIFWTIPRTVLSQILTVLSNARIVT